jgi:hypothetical protein
MIDAIHKKFDALEMTKFSKMRLMKIGLGVDCVDCGNMKPIMYMKVFRNFTAMFKIDKVTFFVVIVLAYLCLLSLNDLI